MSCSTLQELLTRLVAHGDRPALVVVEGEGRRQISYGELAAAAARLAGGLRELGVEPGEPIGLLAENRPEWVVAALAGWWVGAVVMPLDLQLGRDSLAHVVQDSQARFFFTSAGQAERLAKLPGTTSPRLLLLDSLPSGSNRALAAVEPGEPAALFYTSGTTGRGKGVPLSHANLAFQLNTMAELGLVGPGDRVLLPLPLHHVYPLVIGLLGPLWLGLPLIMPDAPTGPRILRALKEGEATAMIGVPRLYQAMVDGIAAKAAAGGRLAGLYFKVASALALTLRRYLQVRAGRLLLGPLHRKLGPSLRLLASGGSPLDPELAMKLEALGWRVAIGYGLTETSPLLTVNPPAGRFGSVGRAVPGVELRIDRPAGGEGAGDGEVLARGPNVFAGYRNLPEQSAAAFTADGWFRTGDLGRLDADGYLFLSGRASTLIVTAGGKNIQPEPLEEVFTAHPLIREAGILPYRQRLAVLLVPDLTALRRAGEHDIEAALRAALLEVSRDLPSYQRPDQYAVSREALPRTRLGKIRRHLLERRYEQAKREREAGAAAGGPIDPHEMSDHDRALLEVPAAGEVWQWLVRRYPAVRLTPDTSPHLDLGVDSLEWLNLAAELGRHFDLELSEETIGRIETVRDLLEAVAQPGEQGRVAPPPDPLDDPEAVLDPARRRWLAPLNRLQVGLAWLLCQANRAIFKGVFRLRVSGLERLPLDRPLIFTPNHVSFIDPFVLAAALPFKTLRRTRFAGLDEVAFANPLFRFICRLGQAVPIDPRRATASSLAFGALTLRKGENLVWFPEGERSLSGRLLAFRPGVGMLLAHHRPAAAVPVAIRGAYQVWPRHHRWPKWHRLAIEFGPAVTFDQLPGAGGPEDSPERIAQALHDRVAALQAGS